MKAMLQITVVGVAVAAAAVRVSADTVTCKDGRVLQGKIVAEDDQTVSLQRTSAGGKIRFTEKIDRADIAVIARGGPEQPVPAAAPKAAGTSRPVTSRPAEREEPQEHLDLGPAVIDDKSAYLAQAIEKYKQKEFRLAGAMLSKLINACKPAELEKLSAEAQQQTNLELAALAADAHVESAVSRARGGPFRLEFVTRYEAEALAKKLEAAYDRTVQEPYAPPAEEKAGGARPRGAAQDPGQEVLRGDVPLDAVAPGQPTGAGSVGPRIADWLERPREFDAEPELAKGFERHVALAIGLLDERIRTDPGIRKDKDTLTKLRDDRRKLEQLRLTAAGRARGIGLSKEQLEQLRHRQEEMKRRQEETRQRSGERSTDRSSPRGGGPVEEAQRRARGASRGGY